jgi:hypothetical protein
MMSEVVRSHDAILHRPSFLQVDDQVVKKLDGKQSHIEWPLLGFSICRCSHLFIEGGALFHCPSLMIGSTSFSARRIDMASSTSSIPMEHSSGACRTAELVKRRPFFRLFMTLLYIHQIDTTFLNRSLTFIIGILFDQFSRRNP